nr:putative capsid protein [Crucivirus sp.]
MPKRSRTTRARGYHYVMGRGGRKHRVYSRSTRKSAYRKVTRTPRIGGMGIIEGYGAYRRGRGGSRVLAGNPPTVQNSEGGFIVRHREFIGDMIGSSAFTTYAFSINPGISATFPWLASVAQNFEEWVPRGIIFNYKTTSSDSVVSTNANAGLGTVIMATEYNPYNGTFASKQQMENYEFAKSCKPSMSMLHAVECSKNLNPMGSYFVRTAATPSTQDIRLYDLGLFQIAAQGMQANGSAIGELWVTYEIELRKPRIPVGVGGTDDGNTNFDHFAVFNASVATVGVVPATPFGTSTTVPIYPSSGSTLGGVLSPGIVTAASFTYQPNSPAKNNFLGGINVLSGGLPTGALGAGTANTYFFPPGVSDGNFMINYNAIYGTGGATWTPVITYTNCALLNLLNADALDVQGNASATTSVSCMATAFINVSAANASIHIAGSTGAYANPTWVDFFVTQIPGAIN